jgi:hypothetical protein
MSLDEAAGAVIAVSRSEIHTFSKVIQTRIRLDAGLGVESDAHQGVTVKHRSRGARASLALDLSLFSAGC